MRPTFVGRSRLQWCLRKAAVRGLLPSEQAAPIFPPALPRVPINFPRCRAIAHLHLQRRTVVSPSELTRNSRFVPRYGRSCCRIPEQPWRGAFVDVRDSSGASCPVRVSRPDLFDPLDAAIGTLRAILTVQYERACSRDFDYAWLAHV